MPEQLVFAMEVFLNGLMAGVMYALVALGFVLIYKASGIFNYAQGVMALFAAMTLVGIQKGQVPFAHLINAVLGTDVHYFGWSVNSVIAIIFTLAVMVLLAYLVQRIIFKHLVGQEPILLFMATIGLAYFLEGFADLMWNSEIKTLKVCVAGELCLPQGINIPIDEFTYGIFDYGFFIDNLDITATIIAVLLVAALIAFSQYTKQGRAMRAVADDCASRSGDVLVKRCLRPNVESFHQPRNPRATTNFSELSARESGGFTFSTELNRCFRIF